MYELHTLKFDEFTGLPSGERVIGYEVSAPDGVLMGSVVQFTPLGGEWHVLDEKGKMLPGFAGYGVESVKQASQILLAYHTGRSRCGR